MGSFNVGPFRHTFRHYTKGGGAKYFTLSQGGGGALNVLDLYFPMFFFVPWEISSPLGPVLMTGPLGRPGK